MIPLIVSVALAEPLLGLEARAEIGSAAAEASTQADLTWGTGPDTTGRAQRVMAVAVAGRRVYLGGEFTAMVPPGSTWPTPTTSTTTSTSAPAPAPVVAPAAMEPPPLPAGSQKRNHLAALDVDTGSLLPWNPDADGPVNALVVSPDGTKLYVGGEFDHIGGTPAAKLARIDIATGKIDPSFTAGVNGAVRALTLHGGRLYAGGAFSAVAGPAGVDEARPKLAALDAATGDLLPWMPPALRPGAFVGHNGVPTPTDWSGDVLDIAVPGDGSRVYVAGAFTDFAGQGGLVVLDATTGAAVPVQYNLTRPLFDLDLWPVDRETVFAAAGGSGGRVYAFHADQPGQPLWSTWVDGDAPGVAASATTVYLMGHYDYAGPQKAERRHLAAFDADSGAVDGWDPVANTPTGAFSAAVGAGHVFVGGEFTRINGRPQPGFAQFDLAPRSPSTTTTAAPGTPATSATTTTTPTPTTTTTTTRHSTRRPSWPVRRSGRPRRPVSP